MNIFSTLCRQPVLDDEGNPMEFTFDSDSATVSLHARTRVDIAIVCVNSTFCSIYRTSLLDHIAVHSIRCAPNLITMFYIGSPTAGALLGVILGHA